MKIKLYKYINIRWIITFSSLLCEEYPAFSLTPFQKITLHVQKFSAGGNKNLVTTFSYVKVLNGGRNRWLYTDDYTFPPGEAHV